jgi:hypothetical protein
LLSYAIVLRIDALSANMLAVSDNVIAPNAIILRFS